tara:strand:+ start:6686 stop:9379 length:2694 start_codon:yes stop_codon:yes gene_type:complete
MLNSYDEGHGVGVDINCVDITMSWEPLLSLQDKYVNQQGGDWEEVTTTWKRHSTFRLKIIKYNNELVPRAYIKKSMNIFKKEDNPDWNDRKMFRFIYKHISESYIKEFIGQLTDDDPRQPDSVCFRVIYFKVADGAANIFYPIRASKYGGTKVGLGDNNIMNLDETCFTINDPGILPYKINRYDLVWEFYFGYYELSDLWSPEFSNNSVQRFRNPLYINTYTYVTGHVPRPIQEIYFQPLIEPLDAVYVTSPKQLTYITMESKAIPGVVTGGAVADMSANSLEPKYIRFNTLHSINNGLIEFIMDSSDLLYRTYNERIKTIGERSFYIVNVRTGIDGPLYTIDLKILTFSILNEFGISTATITLGGSTTFYINIVPEGNMEQTGNSVLYFNFFNPAPHLIKVPERVVYPKINTLGQKETPTFEILSYGHQGDVDEFTITTTVTSNDDKFDGLSDVNSIQVNITNLYINYDYMLIDIYDLLNLRYSNIVQILPRRFEDITSNLVMDALVTPSTADFVTFEYIVTVVNNRFVITEKSSLATTLQTFTYNDILKGKQGDIFHFDTSDPSNYGHKMSFFDSDNAQIAYELRNDNGSLLAEYSRYQPQGTPNSYVSLKLPTDRTTIYYRTNPFNPRSNYTQYGSGTIELDALTYEPIGLFTVGDVDGTSSGGKIDLSSNGISGQVDIQLSVKDNPLFGEQDIGTIYVRTIAISPPINLSYYVINDNDLYLNWEVEEDGKTVYDFADPLKTRYTVDVTYEIMRLTYVTGDPEYVVIGTSDRCEYMDSTAIRFYNYKYKVRSVIKWRSAEVRSADSEYLFAFVCENNQFPEGRWNNTTSNKKLYKDIGPNCVDVGKLQPGYSRSVQTHPGMPSRLTTNLFPNSKQLTSAERYSMLAKSQGRPQR